jgi:hypothetical protein
MQRQGGERWAATTRNPWLLFLLFGLFLFRAPQRLAPGNRVRRLDEPNGSVIAAESVGKGGSVCRCDITFCTMRLPPR